MKTSITRRVKQLALIVEATRIHVEKNENLTEEQLRTQIEDIEYMLNKLKLEFKIHESQSK